MDLAGTDFEEKSELLDALASPIRLKILGLIADRGQISNSDLVAETAQSQPNVTFHLKKLDRVDIIERSREGRSKMQKLNRSQLDQAGIDLEQLLG